MTLVCSQPVARNRAPLFATASSITTAILLGCAIPSVASAQVVADADAEPGDNDTAIVVTGFRGSLQQALNEKRNSATSIDVIVAEDIAKFPDQNLAESLQRIPGVTIERDGGEGRRISVRGLGPQFTTVRLNGLQAIAAGSDNGERSFDFNIFASELFSSLVVHKTTEASLDEGSLGAVVDMNTGNALNGPVGLTVALNGQGAWNSNAKSVKPRLAGLLSYKSPSMVWGANLSVAYSETNTLELGNDTVRWAQSTFDSVDGVPCYTQPNAGGTYVSSPGCDAVALAFHARIPRYVNQERDRERLGVTAGFQLAPTESTLISIDGLYSKFDESTDFSTAEVLFRGNERSIDVRDYQIVEDDSLLDGVPNKTLIAGTFDDAWVRNEHYIRDMNTDFYQLSGRLEQSFGDRLKLNVLGGISRSKSESPIETTIMFDDRDAAGFTYDYSVGRSPLIAFGTDPTDPSNFQLSEIRDQVTDVTNKFRSFDADLTWDATDIIKLSAGGFYRRYSFDIERANRNTQVCVGGVDVVLGTLNCTGTNIGDDAVYGYPVTSDLTELFRLPSGAGAPAGSSTQWIVADIDAAADFTSLYERPLVNDSGSTRGVVERVKGGFVQLDANGDIAGMAATFNAGVRYVHTGQTSRGINSGAEVVVERSYEDWLPAFNATLEPVTDLLIRAAYAEVMSRPSLGDLTPGGSVDGFNYRVTFGNPDLDPFRAKSFDLGLEWYFRPQALFSVAYFKKDVASFPISDTRAGTFASTGLPVSVINPSSPAASNPEGQLWTINSKTNGEGAKIDGWEFSLQSPFWFLPSGLDNFGMIANATFVSSSADVNVTGPGTAVADGRVNVTPGILSTQFQGLSKRSYNGTLYYEDTKLSARVSLAYRSGYRTGAGSNGNVLEGVESSTYVDASASYKLTDYLTLSLEGINLTNEHTVTYADEASGRGILDVTYGRTIAFGARLSL